MNDDELFLGIEKKPRMEKNAIQPQQPAELPKESAPQTAPPPEKKRLLRIAGMLLAALIGIGGIMLGIFLFIPNSLRSESVQFEVQKGESVRNIASDLRRQRLIRSSILFELLARGIGISRLIQSGAYSLSTDMSMVEVLSAVTSQPSPNEAVVTIPEGWTVRDIAQYLESRGLLKASDFLNATESDRSEQFPFLRSTPKKRTGFSPLEGYLFPDTYRVFKDAQPDDIIRTMLKNFDAKLSSRMRDEATLQRKPIRDIIIMASLIEREVRSPEDKAIVSGILWKRLKLGIALQVDASIVYTKTGGRSRTAVDKVYLEDLKIDSPYNTYKNRGLPPAPISNPGIESIEAALYPKSSAYLYYLSTPDGTTIYGKTLEEHNIAKTKYLK